MPKQIELELSNTVVILVNYNNNFDTLACVQSLGKSKVRPIIVVVDNDSEEKNIADDLSFYSELKVIYNKENEGFGRANNRGIKWALENTNAEYVFILNNDTTVRPDTIQKLQKAYEEHPESGLITCKIVYMHDPNLVWYGGGEIDYLKGRPMITDYNQRSTPQGADKNRQVSFASGCAMFFRRSVLAEIVGFDDKFFMYVEDLEMCIRLIKKGYSIYYTADATIKHKVNASFSKEKLPGMHPKNKNLGFHVYHKVKNTLHTMSMHLSGWQKVSFYSYYGLFIMYKFTQFVFAGRMDAIGKLITAIRDFNKEVV